MPQLARRHPKRPSSKNDMLFDKIGSGDVDVAFDRQPLSNKPFDAFVGGFPLPGVDDAELLARTILLAGSGHSERVENDDNDQSRVALVVRQHIQQPISRILQFFVFERAKLGPRSDYVITVDEQNVLSLELSSLTHVREETPEAEDCRPSPPLAHAGERPRTK